jgi:hypothetical protein
MPMMNVIDEDSYSPLSSMQICDIEFLGTGDKFVLTYKNGEND